jgi:hypothetical protein
MRRMADFMDVSKLSRDWAAKMKAPSNKACTFLI